MKKQLIIAFAICVLFLSACGSVVATSTSASSSAAHAVPADTANSQTVCQVLHNRQAQLNQEYQATSAQLSAAQAQGNQQQAGEAEKTLIRVHQSLVQVQVQLKAC
jgi:uncharacterized protein YecT (DUF1311 family)